MDCWLVGYNIRMHLRPAVAVYFKAFQIDGPLRHLGITYRFVKLHSQSQIADPISYVGCDALRKPPAISGDTVSILCVNNIQESSKKLQTASITMSWPTRMVDSERKEWYRMGRQRLASE